MSDFKTKRTPVEMLAEILELCQKPTAKTQIMRRTNLSYTALQRFMTDLQKHGLLMLGDGTKKYVTTEKGLEFIRRYRELQDLLR